MVNRPRLTLTLTLSLMNIIRHGFDNLPGSSRNISPGSLDLGSNRWALENIRYNCMGWRNPQHYDTILGQRMLTTCLPFPYVSLMIFQHA